MDPKKLQKKIDKALAVLSDHDDKKEEKRYKNLRSHIEEAQDYLDKGNHSHDISSEFYNELKKGIKEFEEDRFIFIIFLIILCGMLFIGVFYITYSHFYDYWHPGHHIKPPKPSKTTKTTKVPISTTYIITTTDIGDNTTTKRTTKVPTESTTKTTKSTTSRTTHTTSKVDDTTTTKKTTTITTKKVTTTTTTQVIEPDDPSGAFVTVIFDNSSLIDLENLYPVRDEIGLNSTPTKWSLTSELTGASKDYIVTYTINFVDKLGDIPSNKLMDITKLKYQLLIKKNGANIYNSGVQLMKDYPEVEEGIRPIITAGAEGSTFKNGESLDFELRMWLDSATQNDQQGKQYKFNVFVEATYEFID